jgi:hypothetical protein
VEHARATALHTAVLLHRVVVEHLIHCQLGLASLLAFVGDIVEES